MDKREVIPPLYDIVISMAQEIRRTSLCFGWYVRICVWGVGW